MSNSTPLTAARRESRRTFLAQSTLWVSALTGAQLAVSRAAHAAGSDVLKLGLIGCGGRGSGAAADALTADPQAVLWAMADVFADKIESSAQTLTDAFGDRLQVDPTRRFSGLEGYRGVIDQCDVVLIACASRFHAPYGLAAVTAGKHVFVEKPAAIDVVGVHHLLEADRLSKQQGTGILAGLTYRYHLGRREAVERIHAGEIGEIVAIQCDFLRAPYGLVGRREGWSEMEYQFRNWYHFTWLSGDDIPQSLIHNLDSALWAVRDELPTHVYGSGGRSTQFQPEMGTSFDHASVIYEYACGRRIYGAVRTSVGCYGNNLDVFHGTKGRCLFAAFAPPRFTDLAGKVTWQADEERSKVSPYYQEHVEFLQSIRDGRPLQHGRQLAMSTLTCVLGQMAAYTGQKIAWDEGLNSQFAYPPTEGIRLDMPPPVLPGPDGLYPIAQPGITAL